jgi:hypothetical protein
MSWYDDDWKQRMKRLSKWASPAEKPVPPKQWDLPLGEPVGKQPAPSKPKHKSTSFVARDPHAERSIEGQCIIENEVLAELQIATAAGRSEMTIESLERAMAPWSRK